MKDERGFALPLTILVVTVITMLIASAHVRARADRVIAESSGATVDAFTVAQSGLHRYIAHYDTVTPKARPPDGDSIRINVPTGFADVVARKVRSPTDTMESELYIVRSTGHLIEPTRGSEPQARRSVAQFAQWQTAAMTIPAAFTAANDVTVNTSPRPTVRGVDQCAPTKPTVPGIRTTVTSVVDPADFNGSGAPKLLQNGSGASVASSTMIDWASVVGGQFDADYTSYQDGGCTPGSYPTILIAGDLTIDLSGVGCGLLMVTGDLTLNGLFFNWRGVLLVGGRLQINNAWTYAQGTVVSGLNEQLGVSPLASQIGGGVDHTFEYNHCHVQEALNSLIGFVPISNAWIDNWAVY